MDKIRRFMMGRYGVDQLYKALLLSSIVLSIISMISGFELLNIFSIAILAFAVFRVLSRNIAKRTNENIAFMNWYNPIRKKFVSKRNRLKERKTYKFLKCPKCKQTLRVPKGKGKILITCPKCSTKFETRT